MDNDDQTELLQEHVKRLSHGDSLEAVRNKAGEYVGTLECVQTMGFAREYFTGAGK
jgi:DUF438 domain-containing protein